jgi:hypothetical protein
MSLGRLISSRRLFVAASEQLQLLLLQKKLKLKLATELLEEISKNVRFVGGQC